MYCATLSLGRQELGKGGLEVVLDKGGDTLFFTVVMLLGYFYFPLPFILVLLLHLSHACIALRPLGLASSFLGSLYLYFLGIDSFLGHDSYLVPLLVVLAWHDSL